MLTCREVERILSREEELTMMNKASLILHLSMCLACRTFKKSLKTIADLNTVSFQKFQSDNHDEIERMKLKIKDNLLKKP